MSSGGDSASINVICDTDGNVLFQSVARASNNDWGSGEAVAPHVGKPLIKTYWFDHLDCDHRELQQILRKAGTGTTDRVRVWLRVDENQLIRAELTAMPLTDESGQIRSVLVRTEASLENRRRRDLGEPITKPVTRAETSVGDPLQIRLAIPMLRVDLNSGTILGLNDACSDLMQRPRDEIIGLPLTEMVAEADRRSLIEMLAAMQSQSDTIRTLELGLLVPNANSLSVRLSLTSDPGSVEHTLIVVRDLSAEMMTHDILKRADAMTSVLVRNSERLHQLEAFFDRAPIGLAIFADDQLVRANAAFEARKGAGASPITFRAGDAEDAPIAVIAQDAVSTRPADSPLAHAVRRSDRLAMLHVQEDDSIRIEGDAIQLLQSQTAPTTLSELFADDALDDVRSALQVVRSGQPVDVLETRTLAGREVRLGMEQEIASVLMLIEDVTEWKQEVKRLTQQLQQHAESIAELSAQASAIDPKELATAHRHAKDRKAQLVSLITSLQAGTFTWDINSGVIEVDERGFDLLGCTTGAPNASTLLAAATLDERKAFEQQYFDAVSGERNIDLTVHIGAERHRVRIVGHVLMDEHDGSADPRVLVGVVIDQGDAKATHARVGELERQLAIRNAELNAILESSREAIRIVSSGTLRHNAAAGELFGSAINAFLDGSKSSSNVTDTIVSSTTPVVINGESVGVVSIAWDQSEQKQLQNREAEIAAIFGNTGVGVAFLDGNHRIAEVNSTMCAFIGHAPAQLIGQPIADFVFADDHPTLGGEFDAINSDALQSCTSDLRLLRRDGQTQWVHLTVTRPRETNGSRGSSRPMFIIFAQDIQELRDLRSEREQILGELEETRRQRSLLSATVQDAVIRLDPGGLVAERNDIALTMLALEGRTTLKHLSFIAPETGNALREPYPWTRAAGDRATVVELIVHRPDSTFFVGRFTARADEQGGVTINVTDVSRIHAMQEELQKAYARIVESHTLLQNRTRQLEGNFVSAVQQLGVSIASAYGSAKALRDDVRLPKPLLDISRRVVDSFRVHRRLVEYYTTSATSPRGAATSEVVDVHDLADDAIRTLAERFNIAGRLEVSFDAAQSRCRLDSAMVRHALWSIFAHAASQANKSPAQVNSRSLGSTEGGGRLQLEVAWPGTRDSSSDLTLADSLIRSCGGSIQLEAAKGRTTATIEFELEVDKNAADGNPQEPPLRVLLIEDHESTARVLRRQLERLHCDVIHASSLAEAKSVLEGGSEVALLICDLSLPDDDSLVLLKGLLSEIDIPAVALRSYGGVEAPEDLVAMGFVDHIDKPIDLNALSAAIQRFDSARK